MRIEQLKDFIEIAESSFISGGKEALCYPTGIECFAGKNGKRSVR